MQIFSLYIYPWLISLAVTGLLVITRRWHGKYSFDSRHGVQKHHDSDIPRIGSLGIMAGLVYAKFYGLPQEASNVLGPLMLAAMPAFAFGFLEDVTGDVAVSSRMLASLISGVLAWWLTRQRLLAVDVWGLDFLLTTFLPFSVLFTAFASAGITNSINIIDGFNGLASGVCMVCMGGVAYIANGVHDTVLMHIALTILSATLGFFMFNFPFGKIFLGDGGAYLLGFLLAWMAILLPLRNPAVSPWASMLIAAYPATETGFSMLRRQISKYSRPGRADSSPPPSGAALSGQAQTPPRSPSAQMGVEYDNKRMLLVTCAGVGGCGLLVAQPHRLVDGGLRGLFVALLQLVLLARQTASGNICLLRGCLSATLERVKRLYFSQLQGRIRQFLQFT